MRDHHAFRPRRGAAGVVDREQVGFANRGSAEMPRGFCQKSLVIQPADLASFERDKGRHLRQPRANALNRLEVIGVNADNPRAAVVDHVGEIIRNQAVIERDEDCADLRHGVERFQLGKGVGRDVGDAVAFPHTKRL